MLQPIVKNQLREYEMEARLLNGLQGPGITQFLKMPCYVSLLQPRELIPRGVHVKSLR